MQHTHLLKSRQGAHVRPTKEQLGEPMCVIGVTYRSVSDGLLTGAEMTQRQLHHQITSHHE